MIDWLTLGGIIFVVGVCVAAASRALWIIYQDIKKTKEEDE
jgi:hypothetical protein